MVADDHSSCHPFPSYCAQSDVVDLYFCGKLGGTFWKSWTVTVNTNASIGRLRRVGPAIFLTHLSLEFEHYLLPILFACHQRSMFIHSKGVVLRIAQKKANTGIGPNNRKKVPIRGTF